MDIDIKPAGPEHHRASGAKAFDDGAPIDSHGMNPDARAICDWMRGYRLQQLQSMRRPLTVQQLAGACPP